MTGWEDGESRHQLAGIRGWCPHLSATSAPDRWSRPAKTTSWCHSFIHNAATKQHWAMVLAPTNTTFWCEIRAQVRLPLILSSIWFFLFCHGPNAFVASAVAKQKSSLYLHCWTRIAMHTLVQSWEGGEWICVVVKGREGRKTCNMLRNVQMRGWIQSLKLQ